MRMDVTVSGVKIALESIENKTLFRSRCLEPEVRMAGSQTKIRMLKIACTAVTQNKKRKTEAKP